MDDLALMSATELLAGYRSGTVSPVEATDAALARIDRLDGEVNAWVHLDPERTREQARASEARYTRGEATGLLDGVPVAIKDIFLTEGWPTRKGSLAVDPAGPWDEDAPAVAHLRAHGAVAMGKTATPELGWQGVTDSPQHGITRNPWDPTRTAGGSSGGTAAAIALGMSPIGLGTDGGGSIRIPGGFCGVTGIKPTYGRVPFYPPSAFGSLAHAGPMAWTVTDTALLLDAIASPEPREWQALPAPPTRFVDALEGGVEGLRVAYSRDLGYVTVDSQVADAVDAAVATLVEMGAVVEEVDPGFDDPIEVFDVLWYAGAANAVSSWSSEARSRMDPGLAEVVAQGEGHTAMQYLAAEGARARLGVHMTRFMADYDLVVTPTLPITAFTAGRETPDGRSGERWTAWTPFSYPFNLTQQPAATVPCGFSSEGLPIGLHMVGARHADALVLRAAHTYQRAHPLTDRRPDL